MSVDSGTSASRDPTVDLGCSLCGGSLGGDDDRFVQCYPEDGCSLPAASVGSGFLAVCDDCAGEVDELVEAWTGHADPPVGADHSIATGYRRIADDCGFCDRPLGDEPLLGVECYRRDDGDGATAGRYGNYSLCSGCAPVFEEFLSTVGDGEMS